MSHQALPVIECYMLCHSYERPIRKPLDRGVTLTEPEPEGEKVTGVGSVDTVGERDRERLGD